MGKQLMSVVFLIWSLLVLTFCWSCLQYPELAGAQAEGVTVVELIGILVYMLFLLPVVYQRLVSLRKPKWLGILAFFPPAMLILCFYLTFAKPGDPEVEAAKATKNE